MNLYIKIIFILFVSQSPIFAQTQWIEVNEDFVTITVTTEQYENFAYDTLDTDMCNMKLLSKEELDLLQSSSPIVDSDAANVLIFYNCKNTLNSSVTIDFGNGVVHNISDTINVKRVGIEDIFIFEDCIVFAGDAKIYKYHLPTQTLIELYDNREDIYDDGYNRFFCNSNICVNIPFYFTDNPDGITIINPILETFHTTQIYTNPATLWGHLTDDYLFTHPTFACFDDDFQVFEFTPGLDSLIEISSTVPINNHDMSNSIWISCSSIWSWYQWNNYLFFNTYDNNYDPSNMHSGIRYFKMDLENNFAITVHDPFHEMNIPLFTEAPSQYVKNYIPYGRGEYWIDDWIAVDIVDNFYVYHAWTVLDLETMEARFEDGFFPELGRTSKLYPLNGSQNEYLYMTDRVFRHVGIPGYYDGYHERELVKVTIDSIEINTSFNNVQLYSDINVNVVNSIANGFIRLQNMENERIMIQVYDLNGKLVKSKKTNDNPIEINTNSLSNGTYALVCYDSEFKQIKLNHSKFVKF